MNHAALLIPFVLAAELHSISLAKTPHSRRKINIMRDNNCLARLKRHDESLMPLPVIVVREDFPDHTSPFDLNVARALLEGASDLLIALGKRRLIALGKRRVGRS